MSPLPDPYHIPLMKRGGQAWVFSALKPEQRLLLHWPEAQETFLLNAKRSWGCQFFAHSPPVLLFPPHLLFSLFGVKCRDSGSCSYCYKAARHHRSPSPVFFSHHLCRVAIVVPLNNESAFLLIYCSVFSLIRLLTRHDLVVTPHPPSTTLLLVSFSNLSSCHQDSHTHQFRHHKNCRQSFN